MCKRRKRQVECTSMNRVQNCQLVLEVYISLCVRLIVKDPFIMLNIEQFRMIAVCRRSRVMVVEFFSGSLMLDDCSV